MKKKLSQTLVVLFFLCLSTTAGWNQRSSAGTLSGLVINLANGDFLAGATIQLEPGGVLASTDIEGSFTLRLPPGDYRMGVAADGFLAQTITGITVLPGEVTYQDVALNPEGMDLGEITVVAEAEKASETALLTERKMAAVVMDSISQQEISRGTGSDAADVMQRVTGISIVDDKFVYVRGLGERYSNTMLNNSILPSTQPDKKVVPLDLFPSALLENIRTEKSYRPDQPGEFSGGLVRIETTDFPGEPTLKVSGSQGFGTNTTFQDFMTYAGGSTDWFGFDDGTRALPDRIPDQRVVRASRFSTGGFSPRELERFGESFSNVWNTRTDTAIPNQGFNVVGGNTFGKLGLVLAFSHSNKFHSQTEDQTVYRVGLDGQVTPFHDYDFDIGQRSIRTGIVANLAYELAQDHRLQFRNFYSHDTSDEARIFEGFNGDARNEVRDVRLRFVEEGIVSSQISGEHFLPLFDNSLLEWRLTFSNSSLDEPDLREALYEFNPAVNSFVLADESQSGSRQFSQLDENLWEPALDWTLFFLGGRVNASLKVGGSYRTRNRGFAFRRFRFIPRSTAGIDISRSPEDIFIPENISPTGFELREETRPTDSYDALEITRAGYAMLDISLGRWRFIGGARVEGNVQILETFDLFDRDNPNRSTARLGKTDVLPALSVLYRLNAGMNVRGSSSQTLNRPEFRELTEFEFTDVLGGRSVVGNPGLVRAQIQNYDLRWEWFPNASEVVSASFFFKDFQNPIERVVQPTAQLRTSFVNAESARNAGFEIEARKSLGFLASWLKPFRVAANYTFVNSEVEIGEKDLVVLTSLSRPLEGQSQNVVNTAFEYERPAGGMLARLLFNFQGQRITDVGAEGLPDIIQEGFPRLDAVFYQSLGGGLPWSLKISAENLLNRTHEFTQGGEPFRVFKTGRSFSIGISYSFLGAR